MATNNPLHVEFSNRSETVCAFSHDRGLLKTNSYGDYFFRKTTDGRFACLSSELERIILDLGIKAGERVGIKKSIHNRVTTWHVRRMDAPVETPVPERKVFPHNGKPVNEPLPERCYAQPAAEIATTVPDKSWEDVPQAPETDLLTRCLCEAITAAKTGQAHAAAIGFPLTFSSSDVQDLASTIFIQRCRDGYVPSKPAGRQLTNGVAQDAWRTH